MNIITEVSKTGRIQDGIGTILKLDNATFEKVIERLDPTNGMEEFNFYYATDECKQPDRDVQLGLEEYHQNGETVVRGYFALGSKVETSELFAMFQKLLDGFGEGTEEHKRLSRLLETRGVEAFKQYYVKRNSRVNPDVLDMAFDIVSDEEN